LAVSIAIVIGSLLSFCCSASTVTSLPKPTAVSSIRSRTR
jgi:hypothetical protein